MTTRSRKGHPFDTLLSHLPRGDRRSTAPRVGGQFRVFEDGGVDVGERFPAEPVRKGMRAAPILNFRSTSGVSAPADTTGGEGRLQRRW